MFVRCPGQGCTHLMDPELFASSSAKAKHRASMRMSHASRLTGESDTAFVSFCEEHARMCPACGVLIWRYAGCNHMTCRCGFEFDWNDSDARIDRHSEPTSVSSSLADFHKVVANRHCFDCGKEEPQWLSLNHGTVICLECAGKHRSLGVDTSFVRSVHLDKFSAEEALYLQRTGGNAALSEFLCSQGVDWLDLGISERYLSRAAHDYRRRLIAMREQLSADLRAAGADENVEGGFPEGSLGSSRL